MSTPTRIVLADDHHLVRQGLRVLLGQQPDFAVVGEAGDGLEALRLVDELRPDVAVVDLMMPGLNGVEVIRQIARRFEKTRIVALSMHTTQAYVVSALRNGATAYVLKECSSADLVRGIREAAAGRCFLSPPLSRRALEDCLRETPGADGDPYAGLTPREREVFQLVAEGWPNAAIAGRLFISERTVELHRAHMMEKLGLRSQAGVIHHAIRLGILPVEPYDGQGGRITGE